jgi:hypothetical protein
MRMLSLRSRYGDWEYIEIYLNEVKKRLNRKFNIIRSTTQ